MGNYIVHYLTSGHDRMINDTLNNVAFIWWIFFLYGGFFCRIIDSSVTCISIFFFSLNKNNCTFISRGQTNVLIL